jgi:hypothetical protein
MSRRSALALAGLLVAAATAARADDALAPEFRSDTARLVPAGRMEVGIFGALRLGLSDRIELSTHPLWFFVVPNLEAKVRWEADGGTEVASVHAILYPTPLMRLLSREGTGGLVPSDVTYPQIVATTHQLLLTRAIGDQLVTGMVGIRLARALTAWDGPRFWSQVEWHLAWPRMAAWFTGTSFEAGLAAQGRLWRSAGYEADLTVFALPGMDGDWAVEGTALLTLRPRPGLMFRGGAKISRAAFPYGARTSIPLPMFDVLWSFDAPWGGASAR